MFANDHVADNGLLGHVLCAFSESNCRKFEHIEVDGSWVWIMMFTTNSQGEVARS